MLTYHRCDGTWKARLLCSFQGTQLVPNYKLGVLWLVPPTTSVVTTTVDGVISTGGKNKFRERECSHHYGDGDLYYVGDGNISYQSIAPWGDTFQLQVGTYSYRSSGLKTVSFIGPAFTGGSFSYHTTLPDHTYLGIEFRNIEYDVRPGLAPDGVTNSLVATLTWQVLQSGSWTSLSMTSYTQINTSTSKFRTWTGTKWGSWYSPDSLYYPASSMPTGLITVPRDWFHLSVLLNRVFYHNDSAYFGDLARRCADDAKSIDTNSLEYLRDLSNLVSDGKDLWSLLKGKVSLKTISDLYLSLKYGYRLTYADTLTIADDVKFLLRDPPKPFSWVRAAESASQQIGSISCNSSYHYKIFYEKHSQEFLKGIADLQSVGIFPTPKTVWELIPFSFVVDWFTDLSNRLDELDAQLSWATHRVLGTTMSIRRSYGQIPLSLIGLSGYVGDFTYHTYSRMTPEFVVLPRYFSDAPREFNNYVDLAALILQRRK